MSKPRTTARNNFILIVFDSCRYDSFQRARPKTIKKLGLSAPRFFMFKMEDEVTVEVSLRGSVLA